MVKSASSLGAPVVNRRERERAFRVRLMLEAAEGVFAAHGFDGSSIEEIAGRAEVAIATLYKHFGSKEAIFAALVEHRQDEFLREIEAFARRGDTAAVQLDRLVEGVFRYFDEHADTFRIYLGATNGFPWRIRSSLGERAFAKYQSFLGLLCHFIQAGMDASAWPTSDAQRLAVAVMGCINGILTQRHGLESQRDLHEDVDFTRTIVRRILAFPTTKARR